MSNVHLFKKILRHLGLNPDRLRLEWVSASEGSRFAAVVDDFAGKLKKLGPLGKSEGLDRRRLKLKFEAVQQLIPYFKLVEGERLRPPFKSEEAYHHFFRGEEIERLFNDLIVDKLILGQILLLLREGPLPTAEISEILDLNPSEVAEQMDRSARQGMVGYDEHSKCFTLGRQ